MCPSQDDGLVEGLAENLAKAALGSSALAATDDEALNSPSHGGDGITFLVHAEEDERKAPRMRRISAQVLSRGIEATLSELRSSLSLPASASFLYLAPEFNE